MSDAPADLYDIVTVRTPYAFDESLRLTRCGPGDPSAKRGDGWFAKAWRSPHGPVALRLDQSSASTAQARAWGPGAAWAMAHVPALLGDADTPESCRVSDRGLAAVARRFAGLRLPRVPWPLDKVAGYILQQRVAFDDALESWRRLLWRHGDDAPGPDGLRLLPSPSVLLRLDDHVWRSIDVDRQRQDTLRQVWRYAHRVQETADMDLAAARQRIGALRGVGPWTLDMVMGFGFGDPDAVPVGDYHLPHDVCWALAGEERGDDARMLALLAPYAGQRFRIIRWIYAARLGAPRRGPRLPRPLR